MTPNSKPHVSHYAYYFDTEIDASNRVTKKTSTYVIDCTNPGWEERDGKMVCKGCGRDAAEVFGDESSKRR